MIAPSRISNDANTIKKQKRKRVYQSYVENSAHTLFDDGSANQRFPKHRGAAKIRTQSQRQV